MANNLEIGVYAEVYDGEPLVRVGDVQVEEVRSEIYINK